jgi:hypothetical protein
MTMLSTISSLTSTPCARKWSLLVADKLRYLAHCFVTLGTDSRDLLTIAQHEILQSRAKVGIRTRLGRIDVAVK